MNNQEKNKSRQKAKETIDSPEFRNQIETPSSNREFDIMPKQIIPSRAKKQHLLDQYDVDGLNLLGSGAHGKVYKATNKKDKNI